MPETSSYGNVRKLEVYNGCLQNLDLLSSIHSYSQFSATNITLICVQILESALEPLSSHLPSLDVLVFGDCNFKATLTESASTDITINMAETDIGLLIMTDHWGQPNISFHFDKIIQPHLFLIIQTENPSRTKYYACAKPKTEDDKEDSSVEIEAEDDGEDTSVDWETEDDEEDASMESETEADIEAAITELIEKEMDIEDAITELTKQEFQTSALRTHDPKEVSIIRIHVKSLKLFTLLTTNHIVDIPCS